MAHVCNMSIIFCSFFFVKQTVHFDQLNKLRAVLTNMNRLLYIIVIPVVVVMFFIMKHWWMPYSFSFSTILIKKLRFIKQLVHRAFFNVCFLYLVQSSVSTFNILNSLLYFLCQDNWLIYPSILFPTKGSKCLSHVMSSILFCSSDSNQGTVLGHLSIH